MKKPSTLIGSILTLGATLTMVHAMPGGPPPPPHMMPGGPGFSGESTKAPAPEPAVTEEELGITRDKLETYRKLTFEGFRYYVKAEETQRLLHAAIYQKIRDNTINERLTVTRARELVRELLEISRNNAAIREEGQAPGDGPNPVVQGHLADLDKKVDEALIEKVNPETLTPDLNRREWLMDELIHFGSDTSLSAKRVASLVRRLETLLAAEDSAKESGSLSNSERDKLLKETVETWTVFLRALKS